MPISQHFMAENTNPSNTPDDTYLIKQEKDIIYKSHTKGRAKFKDKIVTPDKNVPFPLASLFTTHSMYQYTFLQSK